MTRVREESKTRGTRPGILVGLAVTGGVITSAGIVLAATFSALAVLPLVFLVQIAFIVALRRAARHLRGALAARARVGLRHRAADLVAAAPAGRPRDAGERDDAGEPGAGARRALRPTPRLSRMTRVALAGYGFAGRDIHAPLLARGGLRGGGGVDPQTRARGRGGPGRHPRVQVVPGLDELLAVPGLDLVVLATPSGGHAAQVRAVVDAGLACVVDKPLAVDAASAADVVRYAAASGVAAHRLPEPALRRRAGHGRAGGGRRARGHAVPLRDALGAVAAGAQGALARAGQPDRGRRHPARPAQPPRRRRGAAVRPCRNGFRDGRRPHHPGRGRRVPRLPARRRGGVAPRGDLAVRGAGPAGAAARHRGGLRHGRLHRRGARVERPGRRRRRAQRLALPR